jgi:N-acetylglucosamine-6-phosphate deacetylase
MSLVLTSSSGWLAFDGGLIVETGPHEAPSGGTDVGDAMLVGGFVDVQINGIGDVDFSRCTVDDVVRAKQRLLSHGVTTFLPTLISAPLDSYGQALDVLAEAGVDGVHLEGPFLGGAPGAHRTEYLIPADVGWMARIVGRHRGLVRMVTLAPEADPGLLLTRLLHNEGVVVSVGHSTATYDETRRAADAGATAVTHLFNAMSPLRHREPGVAGAALDDDRLTPSLIADLVHVHPAVLRLAAAAKRDVALVSDAIGIDASWAAARGVREVGGAPRLQDGTLAGSTLTMDRAVANMVSIGVGFDRAIEMATAIPAQLLGLDDRGALEVGKRADIVALDPSTLEVRAVWLAGERVV